MLPAFYKYSALKHKSVPVKQIENSPAIHRWVEDGGFVKVPLGTAEAFRR
jgi:hypothetical protein